MEIVFGLAADGSTYPDTVDPNGSFDAAVVSPAGFVNILETQLGLTGPLVPTTEAWLAAPWPDARRLQKPLPDCALLIVARGEKEYPPMVRTFLLV